MTESIAKQSRHPETETESSLPTLKNSRNVHGLQRTFSTSKGLKIIIQNLKLSTLLD
jgi:hypothetical protein